MKKIFFNQEESRLKAGWRILLFLMLFFALSSLIFIIKPLLGDITKREFLENYSLSIVTVLAMGATVSVLVARRFWDKKSFVSLGLSWNRQTVKDLSFGFILSGLMAGIFFVLLLSLGLLEFKGFKFKSSGV
jgi:hypothetical protein